MTGVVVIVAVVGVGGVEDLRVGAQNLLEFIEALLEFTAVAGAESGFLAFLVFADGAVATAPSA